MLTIKSQKKITNSTKVLFLTAELAPIAKVGGLADVAGALPKNLAELGVDVKICLPFYGLIDTNKFKPKKIINKLEVPIDKTKEIISVWQLNLPKTNIPVFLIKHKNFKYKKIYCGKRIMRGNKYSRNASDIQRFAFFTRASLETAKALNFKPDIIHAQDWHTALAGNYLKTINKKDDFFTNTKILFTIHNLANQGIIDPSIIKYAKIDPSLKHVQKDLENGDINFMVQGILASDIINTVSKKYAHEILTLYQGANLDNVLKKRKKDLYGILNGIDTDFFNPEKDKFIYKKYSAKTVQTKQENKIFLQKKLGLWPDKKMALVGLVSRLVWQKGIELITNEFANLNCQFVFLGTGQKEYERHLQKLAKKYPHKFSAKIIFDIKLAQQIYASSDIFLMPSRFEPCGLGQMIAMRYGTVPVVRTTGGLADTVFNYSLQKNKLPFLNSNFKKANGFSFKNFNSNSLYKTLDKALDIYYKSPRQWKRMQVNGMKTDFSWNKSAKEYLELYNKLK